MSIVITDMDLEKVLKDLLQKKVSFKLNGKVWRSGRIILFKQSGFYIEFIVKSDRRKQERFEIPIPFNSTPVFVDNVLTFDYRLTTLVSGDPEILKLVSLLKPLGKSKFLDTILIIEVEPDVISK